MYISDGGHIHIREFIKGILARGNVPLRKLKQDLAKKFRFLPPMVPKSAVESYTSHPFPAGYPQVYEIKGGIVLAGNLKKPSGASLIVTLGRLFGR